MNTQHSSQTTSRVDNVVVPARQDDEHRRRVARIKRSIRRETSGGVHQLKVEVSEGTLRLRGRCSSFYCKQKAQHAAMDHLISETLVNEIEVALPR